MPSDTDSVIPPPSSSENTSEKDSPSLLGRVVKGFFGNGEEKNGDSGLREAIEEYIEEPDVEDGDSVSTHERILLSNILKLRDITVLNVMIPRADILAIDAGCSREDLFKTLAEKQYSRFPVYDGSLDDVLGTVHIKDILAALASDQEIDLKAMTIEVPIVSPSLPILDLVLKMRHSRRHMAMVVDEFGGIDGLITVGDIIQTVIGEVDDEHDIQNDPVLCVDDDGSILADARVKIDDFEDQYGCILDAEERAESDTIGGLVFDLAGRVPVRGEVITHPTGMEFEIVDADARKICRVRITKIPDAPADCSDAQDA